MFGSEFLKVKDNRRKTTSPGEKEGRERR